MLIYNLTVPDRNYTSLGYLNIEQFVKLLHEVIQAHHASSHHVGIPKVCFYSLHLNIKALTGTQGGKAINTEFEVDFEWKIHLKLGPLLLPLVTVDLVEVVVDGYLMVLPLLLRDELMHEPVLSGSPFPIFILDIDAI